MTTEESNYRKYRGKCKEFCDQAIKDDPTLTLVRGHYYCPIWNSNEPHWWTVKPDGEIYDPTKLQFASQGNGEYTPFNGIVTCEECGKEVPEAKAKIDGRYGFCSYECNGKFVGAF